MKITNLATWLTNHPDAVPCLPTIGISPRPGAIGETIDSAELLKLAQRGADVVSEQSPESRAMALVHRLANAPFSGHRDECRKILAAVAAIENKELK